MTRKRLLCTVHHHRLLRHFIFQLFFLCILSCSLEAAARGPVVQQYSLEHPFVVTQLPLNTEAENNGPRDNGMLRARYGDGARLLIVYPDFSTAVLSKGFHSACEPDVSFDGTKLLFAGKRTQADEWNIFEASIDPGRPAFRRITSGFGPCRSPAYQSTLYTIISTKPWYQITFVGETEGVLNETGHVAATNLYSCKLDGKSVRRLTYNLSCDFDPFVMQDGRLIFASRRRASLDRGLRGRVRIMGINIDGADFAAYADTAGKYIKHMPCETRGGLCVFVESNRLPWDGAGTLSCVTTRRPLHSYRRITRSGDGLFHSPSPLPDGTILVSRRDAASHGVYRLDPATGRHELVYDDLRYHEIEAQMIVPISEPDGRSSVVTEKDPHGKLYCLDVNRSDLKDPVWLAGERPLRLRVLEGVPRPVSDASTPPDGIPPLVQTRILGEIPVHEDGSFNIRVPANLPLKLQLIGPDGAAIKTCGWIWAKNHEPRGCIGCHEDGELTPKNILVQSVTRQSIPLLLPPEKRRTVDFTRDVLPVITRKCAACHGEGGQKPYLALRGKDTETKRAADFAYRTLLAGWKPSLHEPCRGRYLHPGKARLSPLIWHLLGRCAARRWDSIEKAPAIKRMPPASAGALTRNELLTFIEWVDMGALRDGIPGADQPRDQADATGRN